VRTEINVLLAELRPDAAALVDSFALDDYFLNSALGASGRVTAPTCWGCFAIFPP
jgi:hypothetical protein